MPRVVSSTPDASVWLQICPKCHQPWFIGAARANDPYHCKRCGRDFVIGQQHLPPLAREQMAAAVKR